MEYIRDRILREAIKYLEICQEYFAKSKIAVEEYYSMTNLKFGFIENILDAEKRNIFISNDLESRLEKLYYMDSRIYCTERNAAGE